VDGLRDVAGLQVVERGGEKRFVGNGRRGRAKEATERLVRNFGQVVVFSDCVLRA